MTTKTPDPNMTEDEFWARCASPEFAQALRELTDAAASGLTITLETAAVKLGLSLDWASAVIGRHLTLKHEAAGFAVIDDDEPGETKN